MKIIPLNRHVISLCILICLSCGFYTSTLFASPDYWPTIGWRSSTPEEQGMDSGKLIEMMEKVHNENYAIDSIIISRNGYLIMDAYFHPFKKELKHSIFSCTKSITSSLIGIAIDKGYLKSVNQPILEFFPEKTIANLDERKKDITLEHLLIMASGLETKDSYLHGWENYQKMIKSEDWVQYVLDRPMAQEPGRVFDYSNGGSHLLSAILQKATKMTALEFAEKHLFGPLGITDVIWATDPQGVNIGEGKMMLPPQDMAKIGLLYLRNGRWEDQQIVSEGWVESATKGHIDASKSIRYGYQWWVSPSQYYTAMGYSGQFICVIPKKNMVVVFTSHFRNSKYFIIPKELLDEYIIPAASSSKPLLANPGEKTRLNALVTASAQKPAQ